MNIIKLTYFMALAIALAFPMSAPVEYAESSEYVNGVIVKKVLSTKTTSMGQAIKYPRSPKPEVTALEIEIPPGMETGWHRHPFPGYGYVCSGVLTLEVEGGKRLYYRAGEAFAEMVDIPHNGVNSGTKPVRILAFFTGETGKPYTMPTSGR